MSEFSPLREHELDRIVDTTQRMIGMHPVYGSEGQRQVLDLLADRMAALGAKVRRRKIYDEEIEAHPCYTQVENFGGIFVDYRQLERENLICTLDLGGEGPTVLLNGHIDVEFVTAPQQWTEPEGWRKAKKVEGRLYGRGSSDMLGAVACFVHCAERLALEAEKLCGRLILHFVVDEEIGGNGTLANLSLLDEKIDMALIGEPTDSAVCTQSRSFEQFKISTLGHPRHMCLSTSEENAIWQIAGVLDVVESTDRWCRDQLEHGSEVRSLCAGVVLGGTDAAVPAAKAELLVTAALPPSLPFGRMMAQLQRSLADRFGARGAVPQVEPYGQRFAGSTVGHDELAAMIREVMADRSIEARSSSCFPSACDARIFETFGIPTVIYGPGSLYRAHGPDEYVEIDELKVYAEVLGESLRRIFSAPST